MAGGALAGGVATLGAGIAGQSGARTLGEVLQAFTVSLLVAIGLHLVLGLPDGALEHGARRGIVIAGYVVAVGMGAYLYTQRPNVPLTALVIAVGVAGAVGLVGYVSRCRAARTAQARARLQWSRGASW